VLVAALAALPRPPADIELLHFLADLAVLQEGEGRAVSNFRHRTFFVGADTRAAVKQGLADYIPLSIAELPRLIEIGRIAVDAAFIQVSLPDAFGYVSLGVSVDVMPAVLAKARLVIAEVNPAMPYSHGDTQLHVSRIDHLVPVQGPVIEYKHPATLEPVVEQIAHYVSSIIDDGSTLQIGLGRVPNAALKYLTDRRDLGIHSDVITDAILPLLDQGIITGRHKSTHRHKIVTSFAMGSSRLYERIDRNPLFSFQPIDAVGDAREIEQQHKMVSVTQAFAIDLTGQVCVDQYKGEFYGGLAAQGEFLRGAARSPGGKAVICLASTDDGDGGSRIRAMLRPGEAAAIARTDVHYVITEYGIAYLFGRSIRERAMALIQIAHPRCRQELLEQALALNYLPAGSKLKHMGAYAVEEERTITLKNQRQLLLRPATASDGNAIRELFHRMPSQDVYTRFFRHVRGLSENDVQRLCNLDFDNEVAFVAVSGTREAPIVVAHACYFNSPSSNLAETAFMVHPDWQGCGLGGVMQQRLTELAKRRGIRGFVAEVLSNNSHMIRLAQKASTKVSVEREDGTAHITSLF
jgi:acyl-CoA hydrolase/RimJ/RimL family protein N-acetyltransferase